MLLGFYLIYSLLICTKSPISKRENTKLVYYSSFISLVSLIFIFFTINKHYDGNSPLAWKISQSSDGLIFVGRG